MALRKQILRGLASKLPSLLNGEFGLTTDDKKIYIGCDGNLRLVTSNEIGILSNLSTTNKDDLVGAITEVNASLNTHKNDLITDSDGAHGLKSEIGTWNPTVEGTSVAGSNTYLYRNGTYCRIGNLVWIGFLVGLSAKDTNMAGDVLITGLPYVSNINLQAGGVLSHSAVNLGSYNTLGYFIPNNVSSMYLTQNASNLTDSTIPVSAISNNSFIRGSIVYRI